MDLINENIEQKILFLISKLNTQQKEKLIADLLNEPSNNTIDKTEFQKFLLTAPVMSDEQYKEFKNHRKSMNKWRTK